MSVYEPKVKKSSSRKNNFVIELLHKMTLPEKIGQMVQVDSNWKGDIKVALAAGKIGSILTIKNPKRIDAYQKIATEESRLGIPLLIGNDVIHGYKQTFPIPVALASSWNPALIRKIAEFSAQEAAQNLTNWIFGPMADISRDPRWGRMAESCGEDVFLSSEMVAAWVAGFQSSFPKVAACAKHFAAYGAVEAGRDYNSVDLSERKLREVYLPPFKAALQAGVQTFMTSFTDVNGIPATINPLLTGKILRDEWGFDGVLVSDYDSIGELIHHGVAADLREAAKLSVLAGVDIDMMSDAYYNHLQELVESNEIPQEFIDRSVTRILTLKHELGLFDNAAKHSFAPSWETESQKADELLLQAARESIILLKNENGVLPLKPDIQKIALIGPFSDNREDLLGSWNFDGNPESVETVVDAFNRVTDPSTKIFWSRGTDVFGKADELNQAVELASRCDMAILAVGEPASFSGEAHSRTVLELPGNQMKLCESILALNIPVILILFSGRPLCLPAFYERADVVIYAWQGGMKAAQALAETLIGENNPSAKLPVSIPRSTGQIPVYYAQKRTGRPAYLEGTLQFNEAHKSVYLDESNEPSFPFGFGLSFSRFELTQLKLEDPLLSRDEMLKISLKVKNSSKIAGEEVVQVYIKDEVSSISQPIKELKAFQKVFLNAEETKSVYFSIPCEKLAILNRELRPEVEPGKFTLWVSNGSQGTLSTSFVIC